jgi:hypothetical protein
MYPDYYRPGPTVARVVGLTVVGIVGAVIIAFLFGYFVMLLWNWLLPPLVHVGTINYWQAFGIVILAKILFGGIGGGHVHDHEHRRWRREAKYWAKWGAGPGPWEWRGPRHWEGYGADEWAPKGSYRNWRFYGRYWQDEGKAAFEAWLDKHGQAAKEEDKDKDSGPAQPKAE